MSNILNINIYLPNDILELIWNYINPKYKIFLNKYFYNKYHYLIGNLADNKSYIRDIIRLDYGFVFEKILSSKFKEWISINNYHYGNIIYPNYLDFILNYARDNNSKNCIYLINLNIGISKLKRLSCKDYRIKKRQWNH